MTRVRIRRDPQEIPRVQLPFCWRFLHRFSCKILKKSEGMLRRVQLYSFILISSETTKMSKKQVSTNSRAWYETGIQLICGTNYETNLFSKRTKGITSSANKAIFSAKFEITCVHVFYRLSPSPKLY